MDAKCVSKVIGKEECKKLQELYYRYDGINQLVMGGTVTDVVLSRYEKAYGEYQAMWNEILSKHFNIDLSKGSYSWHCNFSTGEVVVTDNG